MSDNTLEIGVDPEKLSAACARENEKIPMRLYFGMVELYSHSFRQTGELHVHQKLKVMTTAVCHSCAATLYILSLGEVHPYATMGHEYMLCTMCFEDKKNGIQLVTIDCLIGASDRAQTRHMHWRGLVGIL